MPDSKVSLRRHFLNIRKSISPAEARIAAGLAADNFLKSINLQKVKTIAFYHPINGEIDTIPLFERLLLPIPAWKRGFIWLKGRKLLKALSGKQKSNRESIIFTLPTITGKNEHLLFHPWQLGEELVSSQLYPQVLEAKTSGGNVIPDIIIVPLVAFDKDCNRIGYGGGFYDRTIAKLRENSYFPLTVGYAYDCQKSGSPIPTGEYDIKLDFIVTEKCVYSKD